MVPMNNKMTRCISLAVLISGAVVPASINAQTETVRIPDELIRDNTLLLADPKGAQVASNHFMIRYAETVNNVNSIKELDLVGGKTDVVQPSQDPVNNGFGNEWHLTLYGSLTKGTDVLVQPAPAVVVHHGN